MYTLIGKYLYHPALDLLRKIPFKDALRQAEQNQSLSRDELHSIQLHKLKSIVAHAERYSPYYRHGFNSAAVHSSDIQRIEDVLRFPLLDKNGLFRNMKELRTNHFRGRLFKGTTSGSTGLATTFFVDSLHLAWVEASLWRGRRWWGVDRGDRQLVMWARPVEGSGRINSQTALKYRLRNAMQFNTFEQFDNQRIQFIVSEMRRWRPALIYSYGSSLARLVDWMVSANIELRDSERPRLAQYTADHMGHKERKLGAKVLGVPITSQYAGSECGGMAQQCPAGGMHISVDHALIEFLRPDGSSTQPGEVGEVVVTTLHNFAMPLIRYRIGDLGASLPGRCACGLNLPLMRLESGKAVDLITTTAKANISAHVLDYINLYLMKHNIHGIKQFFVDQTARDCFVLTVVREHPFEERAISTFVTKMKETLGTNIEVETRFAESIPLEASGKRRYFKRTFNPAPVSDDALLMNRSGIS